MPAGTAQGKWIQKPLITFIISLTNYYGCMGTCNKVHIAIKGCSNKNLFDEFFFLSDNMSCEDLIFKMPVYPHNDCCLIPF